MIKTFATTLACLFAAAFVSFAHADTPLENSMKSLAKADKQLALDLKVPVDASKSDYLALAATMKTAVQKARDLVPKKAAALPADQQAKMVADYQKSMDDLSATIDTLTTAIQAGQWDDARNAMTKLLQQEHDGHMAFRTKETKAAPPAAAAPSAQGTPTAPAPVLTTPAAPPAPAQ